MSRLNNAKALAEILRVRPEYDPEKDYVMSTSTKKTKGMTFQNRDAFVDAMVEEMRDKTKKTSSNTHAPCANEFFLDWVEVVIKISRQKKRFDYSKAKTRFENAAKAYHTATEEADPKQLGKQFRFPASDTFLTTKQKKVYDIKKLSNGTRICLKGQASKQKPVFDLNQLHLICYNAWKIDEDTVDWKMNPLDSKNKMGHFIDQELLCPKWVVDALIVSADNPAPVPAPVASNPHTTNNFNGGNHQHQHFHPDGTKLTVAELQAMEAQAETKFPATSTTIPPSVSTDAAETETAESSTDTYKQDDNLLNRMYEEAVEMNKEFAENIELKDDFEEVQDDPPVVLVVTDISHGLQLICNSLNPPKVQEGLLVGQVIAVCSKKESSMPDCFLYFSERTIAGEQHSYRYDDIYFASLLQNFGYLSRHEIGLEFPGDKRQTWIALFTPRHQDAEKPLDSFIEGLLDTEKVPPVHTLKLSAFGDEIPLHLGPNRLVQVINKVELLKLEFLFITTEQLEALTRGEADLSFGRCTFPGVGFQFKGTSPKSTWTFKDSFPSIESISNGTGIEGKEWECTIVLIGKAQYGDEAHIRSIINLAKGRFCFDQLRIPGMSDVEMKELRESNK